MGKFSDVWKQLPKSYKREILHHIKSANWQCQQLRKLRTKVLALVEDMDLPFEVHIHSRFDEEDGPFFFLSSPYRLLPLRIADKELEEIRHTDLRSVEVCHHNARCWDDAVRHAAKLLSKRSGSYYEGIDE